VYQLVQRFLQTTRCCAGNSGNLKFTAFSGDRAVEARAQQQVAPVASDASTGVLPAGSGISFSPAGVCAVAQEADAENAGASGREAHSAVPPMLMLTLSDELQAVAAGALLSKSHLM
jgi:hypothetical protein